MADTKASFLWAIKQQESGGDYSIVNRSSGALGAYQVMPSNVGDWTYQALGQRLSPTQFLNNPSAQDSVANTILGGYYDTYGAQGAAAMWYSGQPDPNKNYGTPTVREYVNDILSKMQTSSPVSGSTSTQAGLGSDLGTALGQGLEQGLDTAFKSVMVPILTWGMWFAETGLGLILLIVGVFVLLQKSETVQLIEKVVVKAAVAKGGVR